jgi:hypothetical protein
MRPCPEQLPCSVLLLTWAHIGHTQNSRVWLAAGSRLVSRRRWAKVFPRHRLNQIDQFCAHGLMTSDGASLAPSGGYRTVQRVWGGAAKRHAGPWEGHASYGVADAAGRSALRPLTACLYAPWARPTRSLCENVGAVLQASKAKAFRLALPAHMRARQHSAAPDSRENQLKRPAPVRWVWSSAAGSAVSMPDNRSRISGSAARSSVPTMRSSG